MSDITKKKMEQFAQMWNARGKGLITHMALEIEEVATDGVRVRMPFNPEFCIDSDQTLLHGGILTALLDSVFGLANFVAIEDVSTMAPLTSGWIICARHGRARMSSCARIAFGKPTILPSIPAASHSMVMKMRKLRAKPPRSH